MNKEQDEFGKLRQENEQLRSELDRIESSRTRKRKFGWWFTKKAGGAFAGHWLRSSFLKLYKEIPEQKVQKETLADVSASLLWRITRIGVITIILALLPTAILLFQTNILMRQNKLLDRQNYRLDQQTNLLEAERIFGPESIPRAEAEPARAAMDHPGVRAHGVLSPRTPRTPRTP